MDGELHDSLSGQVALVSGANRGMGLVIADGLADLGATVYAGSRSTEGVDPPGGGTVIELDVTDDATIDRAIERIANEQGRLDVLVNNAGIGPGVGQTLVEEPRGQIDSVLAINLRGPVMLTRRALPHLLEREGSRVVNVSSGMGALGEGMSGGATAYRISKAGLNALTVALHGEFGPDLLANAACPGWVRTDLGGPNATKSPEEGADTPIWLCRFAPDSPGGRFWRDREAIDW
jgi:NAD(P)-dependent dehydrogenase (short-subunit alcohol dehydrogenase family)